MTFDEILNIRKFVISLKRRQDRRDQFEKTATITNYDYFDAIDGRTIEWDGKHPLPTAERHLTLTHEERIKIACGQMACRLSHQKVLTIAKEDNLPFCFISEDDADFDPYFNIKLKNWVSQMPDDWDMLYLGAHNFRPLRMVSDNIGRCRTTLSTVCYMVNSKAYDMLIEALNTPDVLDIIYCNYFHPKINAYCVRPNLVMQRSGWSDIEGVRINYSKYYKD
jgi:GR25 family glycosyltransferase involved in LPS biosynthesis